MIERVKNRLAAAALILIASCGLPAWAQRVSVDANLHSGDKPYVQATGEATVSVKPDQAVLEIGVVSPGATAAEAAADNARQTAAVLAKLGPLVGDSKRLKTTTYSVQANHSYPKPGAAPKITGYTATNVVEVTLDDLTVIGKLLDAATESGANLVRNVDYKLKKPSAVRAQALREAAEEARTSAEAIAAGLGLKILRIIEVEEAFPEGAVPLYARRAQITAAAAPVETPVEVGMIDVSVRVMLRAEVGQ